MTDTIVPGLDPAALEAFGQRLLTSYVGAGTTVMIALGHETGLFEAAAGGPATSSELATRAGLSERHVREWLGAVTTAGIFEYDPSDRRYRLPAEHAALLTGETALNQGVLAPAFVHMSRHAEAVAQCLRQGGGVPYEAYRPEFTDVMDQLGRWKYDAHLVGTYLPAVAGVVERLDAGTAVADLGCGTGHCVNVMARRFPATTFVGYDFSPEAIERARQEASEWGLTNARFEVRDVATLEPSSSFGVITAFDAIHDQADPAGVLSAARDALEPDGIFLMVDIRASSNLEDNVGDPIAPLIYAMSLLHCMEVSLAVGGAGLGTAWGEQLACQMLRDAGFENLEVHQIESDPFNLIYGARRPVGHQSAPIGHEREPRFRNRRRKEQPG
jgi:SAM-dependent methyltransferase